MPEDAFTELLHAIKRMADALETLAECARDTGEVGSRALLIDTLGEDK